MYSYIDTKVPGLSYIKVDDGKQFMANHPYPNGYYQRYNEDWGLEENHLIFHEYMVFRLIFK